MTRPATIRRACLLAALSSIALGASLAHAQKPPAAPAAPSTAMAPAAAAATATFVPMAASGNQFEIESSKLALQRGQSQAVKDFANLMIKDHTAAAAKMKQTLADARLQAPTEPLSAKDQKALESLKAATSGAFDKAYIDAQYVAHVEAVNLFTAYAQNGDNPKVKALADELLPTLKAHLDHVTKMRSS